MLFDIKNRILYEDTEILVCKKPAGLAVQSAKMGQQDMVNLLKNYRAMKKEEPYIGLVHRLDQPVEGVMVFAKSKQAAANLSKQISEKQTDKYYYAVVCGKPKEKQANLVDYLCKDGKKNTSGVVTKETVGAKRAELFYEVVEEKEDKALLRIELKTGRHHQIRVQLSHMGCPIYGDSKYNKFYEEEKRGYMPLALCAYKIAFFHPKNRKKMEFQIQPEGEGFLEFRIE